VSRRYRDDKLRAMCLRMAKLGLIRTARSPDKSMALFVPAWKTIITKEPTP